jgi:hypothetical protein
MSRLISDIIQHLNAAHPERTVETFGDALAAELTELGLEIANEDNIGIVEEAADVAIAAFELLILMGVSPLTAMQAKMDVLQSRSKYRKLPMATLDTVIPYSDVTKLLMKRETERKV